MLEEFCFGIFVRMEVAVERAGGESFSECLGYLAERAHENLRTEVALRKIAAGTPGEVAVARAGAGGALAGVSVLTAAGLLFVEASGPAAALGLLPARPPAHVTLSREVAAWLWPAIAARWRIAREHRLLAMVATRPPPGPAGRWAEPRDIPALEAYQRIYNEERRGNAAPDWPAQVAARQVAVLEHGGRVVAALRRSGETARYACIGGTFTFPEHRRAGHSAALVAFVAGEILPERAGGVHLIVDDDNLPAIALYRRLGFEEKGGCAMAYFGL